MYEPILNHWTDRFFQAALVIHVWIDPIGESGVRAEPEEWLFCRMCCAMISSW